MAQSAEKTTATSARAPLRAVKLGPSDCVTERKADGTIYVRSPHRLPPYPDKVTERLVHWAEYAPDRLFLADRGPDRQWRKLAYGDALTQVRAIGQSLLQRNLSPERPIIILSGNDLEHALLGLAAMHVGIPYAPVSTAYSLMSSDFGKLRHIVNLLTPGLVFAADGKIYGQAIDAVVSPDVEIVVARNAPADRPCTLFADLLATTRKDAVDGAYAQVGPDSIAKFLFTSGSTGMPKGVINTHRMLCANAEMIAAGFAFVKEEPPVVLDWLPWNHTFGSNHNFNLVLFNGGSLFVDDGRPLPGAIEGTVRNLREVAPTIYFNVPRGYDALIPYLRADEALRKNFFSRLKVLFYAAAALPQHSWDALRDMSVETTGERIIFLSSLGSTETSPLALACTRDFDHAGNIGLPTPGVELKLVPNQGKLEARLKGANITPGYWREPDLTAAAFDDEGFYRIGDALKFVDPADPAKGLLFDGRLAEDFKLSSGTWVSVGTVRAKLVEHFGPFVRDAVIAAPDRDEIRALLIPDVQACRRVAPDLPADAPPARILSDPRVKREFAFLVATFAKENSGSSTCVRRVILLVEPPSLDVGEITDKGSINQRAVLNHRAALVEDLFRDPPPDHVILADDSA
jgi:feruloyl-CoA synthase